MSEEPRTSAGVVPTRERDDPILIEDSNEIPGAEGAAQYLAAVKATLTPENYSNFIGIIRTTVTNQGRTYGWVQANVKECLKDFRFLLRGFNQFLPKVHQIELPPANYAPADLPSACGFLHNVKRCVNGEYKILDSFLQVLQDFGDSGKSVNEIYREVALLLRNDQELLKVFIPFLPESLKPTATVSSSPDWKSLVQLFGSAVERINKLPESVWSTELLLFSDKAKGQLSAQDYNKLLDYLNSYSVGRISTHDLQYMTGNLLSNYPAMVEEFKHFMAGLAERRRPCGKRGRNGLFISKGTSTDDKLSHQIAKASNTSEFGKKNSNYRLGSVASGNEESGDAPKESNPYAEKLLKCTDEMLLIDRRLGNISSVISRINRLLEKINDRSRKIKFPIRLEKHFKARNMRLIAEIYGNKVPEILEELRHHPQRSLPVLLERMQDKQQKWADQKSYFLKHWCDIMMQNYHKVIDPEQFTQIQDTKKMRGKEMGMLRECAAFLSESKEIADKKRALHPREEDKPGSSIRRKRSCLQGQESSSAR